MPFAKREPVKQGFIQKLFGFKHIDAVSAEIETIISKHWPNEVPTRTEIAQVEATHGVVLAERGISVACKILQMAAEAATARLPLPVPLRIVEQLADSLGLQRSEASKALRAAGLKLLHREITRALDDEIITHEERDGLHLAATEVGLTSDDVAAALVHQISPIYSGRIHQALSDGQLSPEEEQDLARLAENLGLSPQHDSKLRDAMDRARTYWNVLHGPLPSVESPFYLQKNEQCSFTTSAQAFERRSRTRSVGYAGASVSIPIVRGVRFRIAQGRVQRQTEEYQHSFGTGTFCATNKRLIWNGPNKNISINLRKVIDFEPYTDGVQIVKDSGKPVLFVFAGEAKYFGPLLSRLIDSAHD